MTQVHDTVPATRERPLAWWATEDWLAVWIGAVVLVLILLGAAPSLPGLRWSNATSLAALFTAGVLGPWLIAGVGAWLLSAVGVAIQGNDVRRYTPGFLVVFALAWASLVLAGHATANAWGIEYVIFALVLGLVVNHAGAPAWIRAAARTEFFIKTGLVIMGATILVSEVLQAGVLGLLQAIVVVIVVWYVAFWLARRFRIDDEFGVMLASAVSICGVSAAIATCGAIQGDRRKLSYVTSVVLIVALPMIVLMPWIARAFHIPDIVAGAWLGGTLDTTGSVVAAGALVSETAMKVGTIVKFSQNVLIGFAAFVLSVWWTLRQRTERTTTSPAIIWERFPKFVLGFIAASMLFPFALSPEIVARTKSVIGSVRTLWFALAFVSIGLETRLSDLFTLEGGRPLTTFVLAQAFNVFWTLVVAWLVFGGVLFQIPAI